MKDNNKIEKEKENDKTENNNSINKNEINIVQNNNQINEDLDVKENKNKIIIDDENIKKENEEYFKNLFNGFKSHFNNCESAIQNDIKNFKIMKFSSNNRDLLWQIFLGVLPYNSSDKWNRTISEERSSYVESKKKLITKDIEEFIMTKKVKDQYSLYFKFKDILSKEDYEFLDIIKIDVTRTFQKVELFKQEKIQKLLINILFIFAKIYNIFINICCIFSCLNNSTF